MFSFDAINVLLAFMGTVTLSLGFITFLTETKNRTNRLFFYFVIAAFAWIFSMLIFRGVGDEQTAELLARLLYFSAASIPIAFLFFSFAFTTEDRSVNPVLKFFIWIPYLLISLISLLPGVLIQGIEIVRGQENVIIFDNLYHTLYALYINSYFLWVYINLIRKYLKSEGIIKTHLRYVIIGTLLSTLVGVTTNLLLPLFGNFDFNWLGQVMVIFMIAAIFYSISKHHLFNAKVVTTELFVFILWAFIIGRIVLAEAFIDQIIESILLLATIVIGVLLVRSVIKEVHTRERMEILANKLATANERLTVLDRQKSEFLSIASHQLRSPLTAIKGYSSMILEGSFGKMETKMKEAVERIYLSSERLVIIIEDFLNVSRIEQGRMQYEFSSVKLAELVQGVVEEWRPTAEKAHLYIKFESKPDDQFYITADFGKIRQVVTNIIDNAIKYTQNGGITLVLDKDEDTHKVLLKITDTGMGISRETLSTLFQKFTRAKGAGLVNAQGTGLGLYVVKELMKAHNGSVWVDSPGLGKGSTFYLEFMGE